MSSSSNGNTSGSPPLLSNSSTTRLVSVTALIRHWTIRLLSSNWRHTLRPRVLFAWDGDNDASSRRRRSQTAWLDGARGVAALQVFFFHFVVNGYADSTLTYGSVPPEDRHFFQHPLIRPIWCGGGGAICTFFVISGYALTTESFALIRTQRFEELYQRLCSSVLRRWFRLWLPVIFLSIPMIPIFQYWPYVGMYTPPRKESLGKEIMNFLKLLNNSIQPLPFMNSHGIAFLFDYIPQAWTIPTEYYCSMVCYLVVMMISRMPAFKHRAWALVALGTYALHYGVWWVTIFLVGMLLADWDQEQQCRPHNPEKDVSLPQADEPNYQIRPGPLQTLFHFAVFFVGYYLGGAPNQFPEVKPYVPKVGYEFLYRAFPPFWLAGIEYPLRWYHSLSACFMMYGVSQSPVLRRIFETKFCQWLGKLSFALYLIHVQMIGLCSGPLRAVYKLVTRDALGILPLFVLEFFILGSIVFITAAAAWRYVDRPSVRFAKWLDDRLTGRDQRRGWQQEDSRVLEERLS